ncbi:MAG: hypothetical protein KatS3mg034_0769 [Vicingaceae bacterium]|nr:MAG: hypothetical protein KatS3mg034_0769 [Vicingaceae bacterium]
MSINNNIFRYTCFCFTAFVTISCKYFQPKQPAEKKGGKVLAKVGNRVLLMEDIQSMLPENITGQDSVLLVEELTMNWVKENLLLEKAQMNISEEELKQFDKLIEDYRKSLLLHAYETKLLNQYLDTLVTDEEIKKYFEENQKEFELKENIVKAYFFQFNKEAPKLDEWEKKFREAKEKDENQIFQYVYQFSIKSHVDTSVWILLNDLKQLMGQDLSDEQFFRKNHVIKTQDSSFVYFAKIFDYKVKESLPPVDFVKDQIKTMILMKRRLHKWQELKTQMYEDAIKNGMVKIYTGKSIE